MYTDKKWARGAVHAQCKTSGAQLRPAWRRTVLLDLHLSSARALSTRAPTGRLAESAVHATRRHHLVRSRLLLSGGAVTLDEALVGMIILMRWAAPHGWAVGKVTSQITTSTPRGHASFEKL